ncbi:MAG: TIM barrel protein [Phycisphaerae bacterium]|nr:sugar phosphate isomerase/epimerase [Phycisphaerae bacterium]NIU08415.1 sugar phosphate isomerase/epimerase [Phycisphaerae bacterium]NIU55917.1 TIM barrel protein [Phycisphaerae bacterium]NIW92423.1 TIM barrel protein [Phycisphaerae bacterium]
MKIGFLSAILADLTFEEVISFAAESGYSCVEIMCWPVGKAERRYAGVTHIDVTSLSKEKIDSIQSFLSEKGVSISGLGYYPNPLEADDKKATAYIEHIKKVIEAANQLGLENVNTFIGRDHQRNIDDNFEKFKQLWPPIVKYAEEKGVKIGIENCPMFFSNDEWPGGKNLASSPAIWRRMFEEIPSANFGLNYDPSHLVWQFMDYIRPIHEFKDRIFHVHIKDAKVLRENLNDVGILATPLSFHSPKLPGLGDVDWGKFFSALTEIGYNGPACVEVEDRDFEGSLEMRKRSLIQSREYLKQYG